jgi:hypothetical protein
LTTATACPLVIERIGRTRRPGNLIDRQRKRIATQLHRRHSFDVMTTGRDDRAATPRPLAAVDGLDQRPDVAGLSRSSDDATATPATAAASMQPITNGPTLPR